MPIEELELQFYRAMVNIYERARAEEGYTAARFLQMVIEHGGVEAARMLVNANTPSDGYTMLWKKERLDLTVEALVIQNQWQSLFDPEEIKKARQRLKEYEYNG